MKKILVIEDNTDVRENIAEILELSSYKVLTAENGREGVKIAKEEIPSLIICDIMMPELDGYGVLHMLGKDVSTATIPFIFLTAKAEKSDIRKGMNLGADDYLTKPFDETELLSAVEIRLKRNNAFQSKEYEKNGIEGLNTFFNEAKALDALNNLSEERKTRVLKKKDVLFYEGDYPNSLYYIINGKLKIYKVSEDGKELVTDILTKGDFVGYMPMIENREYYDNAAAIENTELSIIPKDDFIALLHSNRDVSSRFIKLLSKNIAEKEERLLKLAYTPVRERVADVIISLYKKTKEEGRLPVINLSREDMASIVGTATESLIRVLSEFKEDNLIEISGREIKVSDPSGLERVANFYR
jgi:CRP/FNR family transcriptional regulator, polysaccharide utilization system transcription regulator